MKNPKHMNSHFPGYCDTCGRHIKIGERIYWKSRGTVDCIDCAPELPTTARDTKPQAETAPASTQAAPASNAWADALAWDDSEHVPGASIQASEPLKQPAKPRVRVPVPETVPAPMPDTAKVVSIAPKHAESAKSGPIATETATAPAIAPDSAPDVVVALIQDQLTALVNAIGNMSPEQITQVREFLEYRQDRTNVHLRRHCFSKLAELFGA